MNSTNRYGRREVLRWMGATALTSLLPVGCSQDGRSGTPAGTPMLRVLLLENQPQVSVGASESPTVRVGGQSTQQLHFGTSSVPVTLTSAGWRVGSAQLGSGEMVLDSSAEGSIKIAGRRYHGRFRFLPTGPNHFDVINELDLETYLRGVLASELFPNWHEEAYKAQAIVARTYALYEARTDGLSRNFDVFADQRSQVYGGITAETARSRQAAQDTMGIVVASGAPGREVIFKSYFSSCCGGIGQSAYDAFGDFNIPPLSAQNRGLCCSESPKFNWGPLVIPKGEITRRIRAWGAWKKQPEKDINPVTRIDIRAENQFGRPVQFTVTDSRGQRYGLRGEQLREAVNTDAGSGIKLPSSFCKPVDEGAVIRFADGHGYGHGVGMCQWCAERQASQGWNDEAIVLGAFPTAKLVRAY